jgi:hypothetical protein
MSFGTKLKGKFKLFLVRSVASFTSISNSFLDGSISEQPIHEYEIVSFPPDPFSTITSPESSTLSSLSEDPEEFEQELIADTINVAVNI